MARLGSFSCRSVLYVFVHRMLGAVLPESGFKVGLADMRLGESRLPLLNLAMTLARGFGAFLTAKLPFA